MVISEQKLVPYRQAYQSDILETHLLDNGLCTPSDEYFALKSPEAWGRSPGDEMTVAVVFAFRAKVPILPYGLTWAAVSHQAGGIGKENHYLVATELDVVPALYDGLCRIALDRWPGHRAGWDGAHTDTYHLRHNQKELTAYRSDLAELGLSYSGDWLTESLYPIDATQSNLDRLCQSKLSVYELGLGTAEEADLGASIVVICNNSN